MQKSPSAEAELITTRDQEQKHHQTGEASAPDPETSPPVASLPGEHQLPAATVIGDKLSPADASRKGTAAANQTQHVSNVDPAGHAQGKQQPVIGKFASSETEQTAEAKLHSDIAEQQSDVLHTSAVQQLATSSNTPAPAASAATPSIPLLEPTAVAPQLSQPEVQAPPQLQSSDKAPQAQQQPFQTFQPHASGGQPPSMQSMHQQQQQGPMGGGPAALRPASHQLAEASSSSLPQRRDAAAQTQLQQQQVQQLQRDAASGATDSGGEGSGDESSERLGESRGAKKPRLVWTAELHARFMNAVNHLGVKNAVPKTILQLMNVDGMTRENVASHLQKYRLYLKKLGGYPANAKTTPEALQQVQQQALQQQAQEAMQQSLNAMQGVPSHNISQGYFGPPSLTYSHGMTGTSSSEGYQLQGPQGPSAPPSGWFPGTSAGHQAFEGQRGPGAQQMASNYGLLPPRGAGPAGSGPYMQQGSQPPWSTGWGQGPSETNPWSLPGSSHMEGGSGHMMSQPRQYPPHAMYGVEDDPASAEDDPAENPGAAAGTRTGSDVSTGQMPDALAHLLSAAEAASSEGK